MTTSPFTTRLLLTVTSLVVTAACPAPPVVDDGGVPAPSCATTDDERDGEDAPDFLRRLGCPADHEALASEPLDARIPGARSAKVVYDRTDGALYVQHSGRYPIHWEFARAHLSGNGKPFVDELAQFNTTEYTSPERRFVLGAVTHYEGPDVWAYELAPYDTATVDMVQPVLALLKDDSFLQDALRFHPTSTQVAERMADLQGTPLISTDDIFAATDYQPLNLGTSVGRLRFFAAADVVDAPLDFRDIVVLDAVPNDISVVAGIITGSFQTPLSHINVLSQNRGTPNMGLRDAQSHVDLVALQDKWVRLTVDAQQWSIAEVTQDEADTWWEANRPPPIGVPRLDVSVRELVDVDAALDDDLPMKERIKDAIPALGGKAAHYAELASIDGVPVPQAFVIPVAFYMEHLQTHGIDVQIDTALDDERFDTDVEFRRGAIKGIRDAIKDAPVDGGLLNAVRSKIRADFAHTRMRFRSSTNAEDLEGFTGAGLYTSKSGDLTDPDKPIDDAIRKVWASVWGPRAVDERRYRGIAHREVGMALLVHRSFPDEYANGVALTANPFDRSGLEPAFYINVQRGEFSVVLPPAGVTTDQLLYQYTRPGQPAIYLAHSNQVPDGESVLDDEQLFALGTALQTLHTHFARAYGPPVDAPTAWYAMDVEFKFDDVGDGPQLFIKQARPHPGWGEAP